LSLGGEWDKVFPKSRLFDPPTPVLQDISKVAVNGLSNLSYIDKVLNGAKVVEENQKVNIAGEVDRVYVSVPDEVTIEEDGQAKYRIVKTGMKDTGK
jgi:D-hexose-6-phosphate mutarotase